MPTRGDPAATGFHLCIGKYGPLGSGEPRRAGLFSGPADCPVSRPGRFEWGLHLKTAQALSLTIPHAVPIRGDTLSRRRKTGRAMATSVRLALILLALAAGEAPADAQPARVYRVGVVLQGGPYYHAIDGLRDGLKEVGFQEGTQYRLHVRDAKGDLGAVAEAARALEQEHVDLIYSIATSVTLAVKRATATVPIVFYAGTDPVVVGLVKSFARPCGWLTGVHTLTTDLTGKRLELLKEILPKLRRVVTFYDPGNASARESAKAAQEAARHLRIKLVERHVRSVEELQAGLGTLKAKEVDACFLLPDAMVISQTQFIVDTAKAKKLPTMSSERDVVVAGGLASYGVSHYALGRLSAKYIHRVLLGTSPADLPVEGFAGFELVLNARTARELGLTLPQSLLNRADEVMQ